MSKDSETNDIEMIHRKVETLLTANFSDERIIQELTEEGFRSHYIETVIGNVRNDLADKRSFRNSMIMGAIYILGGLIINYFSYIIPATAHSFVFYLFWGIIVLGITTIARGFILYRK